MLIALDYFFSFLHLALIGFNLLGWIWPKTRKEHLVTVLATAASWFILGIWFGWGYCPITDWQWDIKEKLGETNLPNSFIKYFADKIAGRSIPSSLVDRVTLVTFIVIVIVTIVVNIYTRRKRMK
jgi:hypothetical protein